MDPATGRELIFVDANLFLRFLAPTATPEGILKQNIVEKLLQSVDRGMVTITTSEVVLHEVCWVMTAKAHYGVAPPVVADKLRPLLSMPGFRFPRGDKAVYLRALDIYEANPKLEFSDSVIAARTEKLGVPLATFDEQLGSLPFLTRWQPQT